jgi:hypothetical protein
MRMLTATHPLPRPESRSRRPSKAPTPDAQTDATPQLKTANGLNTVTKTTDPWWVGSTLYGAPTYGGAEATFHVPTPIPSGDETFGGTIIAIWTGVDGGDEALIQAGVNLQTTATTSVFWSWREFCCGDGISNSYSGAFTPNPGDKIYSDSWYCDDVGRLNVNGGYGCSYLADLTLGLVLSCIDANGSPCPSAPAAPSWTSFGIEADFVIEDQTPQL